jgi:hypothetical protein
MPLPVVVPQFKNIIYTFWLFTAFVFGECFWLNSLCKKTLYLNADMGLVIKIVMNTCA